MKSSTYETISTILTLPSTPPAQCILWASSLLFKNLFYPRPCKPISRRSANPKNSY